MENNLKRLMAIILLMVTCVIGCNENKVSQEGLSSNTSESPTTNASNSLLVDVDESCFTRFQLCENGVCKYSLPSCSCPISYCSDGIPAIGLNWGAENRSNHDVVIEKIEASILNQSGGQVLLSDCGWSNVLIKANHSIPGPIAFSCSSPDDIQSEYQSSPIDFFNADLQYTFYYHEVDGEKKSVVIKKKFFVDSAESIP